LIGESRPFVANGRPIVEMIVRGGLNFHAILRGDDRFELKIYVVGMNEEVADFPVSSIVRLRCTSLRATRVLPWGPSDN
jgi:hypothetical protein